MAPGALDIRVLRIQVSLAARGVHWRRGKDGRPSPGQDRFETSLLNNIKRLALPPDSETKMLAIACAMLGARPLGRELQADRIFAVLDFLEAPPGHDSPETPP